MSLALEGNGTLSGVDASASGLVSALGGIGSNVVHALKQNAFTTTSTTFVTLTDLSVTITPTSNTSKILVMMNVTGTTADAIGGADGGLRVIRDATPLPISTAGSALNFSNQISGRDLAANDVSFTYSATFLDSPATTSATTYEVQVRNNNGNTIYINTDVSGNVGSISTLTVIEVAA